MEVAIVTAPSGGLLAAVRETLAEGNEGLVCVAFAQARGVHLVQRELEALAARGSVRIVVTTALGMSSDAALSALRTSGAVVRVLNPGGATYHPKVFITRGGGAMRAVVGSANLTSGLVANIEAATLLRRAPHDLPLSTLWSWAESIWSDPRTSSWDSALEPDVDEAIEPDLLAELAAVVRASPTVYTLGPSPRPNYVRDVNASGLWVETARSREREEGAQLVPPRMLNLAWDALRARGRLTNRELLDELRVH